MRDGTEILIINDNKISEEEFLNVIIKDIENIDTKPLFKESLPFDKWDWIVIAITSTIAGLADIVLGKPSGFSEPKIKNSSFGGLGEKIKKFDLKDNPIDFLDPHSFGGDHRLYSYGHDLFRFFEGVRQTMVGEYRGISGLGGELVVNYSGHTPISFETALLTNIIHLIKDFCTAKSLPIPGMTVLANLNNDKMPEFAEKMYIDGGYNLRTLSGQVLSVTIIELVIRIYLYIKHLNKDYDKDLKDEKLNKMLIVSHCIAMLFNLGKVAVTQNPFMLNIPQLFMIIKYALKIYKQQFENYKIRIDNKGKELDELVKYSTVSMYIVHDFEEIFENYEKIIQEYVIIESKNELIKSNSQNDLDKFNLIKGLLN